MTMSFRQRLHDIKRELEILHHLSGQSIFRSSYTLMRTITLFCKLVMELFFWDGHLDIINIQKANYLESFLM
jgi:hypothetical protein